MLDVLLGAQPECWTLGEFQLLDIGAGRQMECGCHAQLSQCDFWGPILHRIRRTITFPIGYYRSGRHPNGRVVRWHLLPSILLGRPLRAEWPLAHTYAASNLAALEEVRYAAEQHQEKVRWFVDASKDPYRLHWLQASGYFDIKVIHLIRRPEGFVWNMMRSANTRGIGGVIKYTSRWIVDNFISSLLLKRAFSPEHVKVVHYEDLARDPEAVVGGLCSWLAVPFDAARAYGTRFETNHGIAGNRPRWDELEVRFEETWRLSLSKFHKILISLLTAPFVAFRQKREPVEATSAGAVKATGRAPPRWTAGRSSPSGLPLQIGTSPLPRPTTRYGRTLRVVERGRGLVPRKT